MQSPAPPQAQPPPQIVPGTSKNIRDIQLPLSASSWATLSANFPLSEDGWKRMITVLEAMKPALVAEDNDAEE